MYRSAAKRLLQFPAIYRTAASQINRTTSSITSTATEAISKNYPNHSLPSQNPNIPFSSSSSSTTSFGNAAAEEGKASGYSRRTTKTNYEDEQTRVLNASLRHVLRLGWTEAAMIAGAREVGVSPSIVGSFPRKEAAVVEHFMDECLEKLIDVIESGENLSDLVPSERIVKLVRMRLEMQAPYISKWPQALSIQAQPANVPTSFKQRAMLVDEIWHAAGDEASDVDWYVKRTVLAGIYSTTEIYMLTDVSQDFRDTWAFLNGRVRDAFDLKNTIQEVTYLAEAIGAGMGSSVQGFMKTILKK